MLGRIRLQQPGNLRHQRVVCQAHAAQVSLPPTREGGRGLGASGSGRDAPGFGSVNNEHTESSTFEMVNAGLHWLCRMSRQMLPLLFTLQW